jgi:formate dehydrogenase subunit gamma
MPGYSDVRALLGLVLLSCVMLFTPLAWSADSGGAAEQAQRQQDQPLNNAPVWREVRKGENPYQTTQVRGVETNVLVQTQGEIWRQIRNGPITIYGGWLLVVVTALIGLYYWLKGPLKLHKRPTGRLVERFSGWERAVHWLTAISFVVLALSGLVILFGKYILLPAFGYTLFSWLAILAKNLHNFIGPLFAVGTVLMFFTFVKDNFPQAHDWIWIRKGGGFLGAREHVPSGRFNAGEKSWFWIGVTLLGIVSAVTGFVMLFPNLEQGRSVMQFANVIHAVSAMLFISMALGHIYVGTIGVEKAYETMRTGMADESWAEEHHEYWYNEVKRGRPGAAGTASAARAGAMKEGWKL